MADNSPHILDVAEADFERSVIERSREVPVVVDFWAEWCGPCRTLGPLLERLAEEAEGKFVLAKVDVERAQELAVRWAVQAIPAVKAFRDGRVIDEFVGVLPERELRAFLEGLQPSEAEELVREGANLEGKDRAAAETSYRKALELDPRLDTARLGLARTAAAEGRDEEAASLLENLIPAGDMADEVDRLRATLRVRRLGREHGDVASARARLERDPENPELHYALGCALAAGGEHEQALATLLSAAELDKALAKEKVREAMVEVFHVVGTKSPLANEYRRKLSRLLY